jgi:hypothetical protein
VEVITVPLDGESAEEHLREALAEAAGQQASEVGQARTWSLGIDTGPGLYTTPVGMVGWFWVAMKCQIARLGAAK